MLSGRMFTRGVNITDLRGTISTRMSRTGGTHISHQDAADEAKSCRLGFRGSFSYIWR